MMLFASFCLGNLRDSGPAWYPSYWLVSARGFGEGQRNRVVRVRNVSPKEQGGFDGLPPCFIVN
jgi:hypothetical protein